MKGQAFITLPSQEAATIAVSECHSYKLNDKPMIVSYAKSKPKITQLNALEICFLLTERQVYISVSSNNLLQLL